MAYSRDVRFNEEQTGVQKIVRSPELDIEQCVELELTSDDLSEFVGDFADDEDSSEIGDSEPVHRSTRERRRPDYLAESVSVASAEETGTYREAVSSPRWKQAMADEMKSLENNEVRENWLRLHLVERLSVLSGSIRSNEMVMVEPNGTRHDWWRKATRKQEAWIMMRRSLLWSEWSH